MTGSNGFLLPANQISTVGRELWAATSVVSYFFIIIVTIIVIINIIIMILTLLIEGQLFGATCVVSVFQNLTFLGSDNHKRDTNVVQEY